MKTIKLLVIAAVFVSFSAVFDSCQMEENTVSPFVTEERAGQLVNVEGSTLECSDLEICSFLSSADLDGEGNFVVEANEADKYQQLLVLSKNTENVIYIGLYDPETKKLSVSDTSTVISLLLTNPQLFNTSQEQRREFIQAIKSNDRFPDLLSCFDNAIRNDAETALSFETNPLFYQMGAEMIKETIEALQINGLKEQNDIKFGGEPTIEDGDGNNILFVNPRHVTYGAGIYPNNGALKEVVTVRAQTSIVGLKWDWPPVGFNEPAITQYSLNDGQYRIYLNKGLDFSKFTQWNDPVGRATIMNTGALLINTIDLLIGYCPSPELKNLPGHFHIKATRLLEFEEDFRNEDVFGFADDLLETLVDNKEELALWIWESISDADAQDVTKYMDKFAGFYKNWNIVFKLLSFANGPGPFYFDMIFAPKELTFNINQQNGNFVSLNQNLQPEVNFTITPPAGIIGTDFVFDGSGTSDDNDNISALQFRWDFDSDGQWDTDWSSGYTSNHSYSVSSSYNVTLAVKDSEGLIGTANHILNVGGGAGTASHVKLFMDVYPWDSDAIIRMLKAHGFTEGSGDNTYEIITSAQMQSVSLIPGQDLVIISNDQPQTFYNNYAASGIRFTNFVNDGGALFWEACDNGWNRGSMVSAGLKLPGNIKANFKLDNYNFVSNGSLPLVSGIPTQMDHNYASHEFFTDLVDGTTVYCVDSQGNPTLIEFNFGSGWIIVSGQPLEHQYDRIYGAQDMEKLLPAIVTYFTGKTKSGTLHSDNIKSTTPSYLTR